MYKPKTKASEWTGKPEKMPTPLKVPQPTTALWYVYLSKNMWNYLGQNVFRLKYHPEQEIRSKHYLRKVESLMSELRHEMVTWKIKSCLIVIVQIQNVPLTWWPLVIFQRSPTAAASREYWQDAQTKVLQGMFSPLEFFGITFTFQLLSSIYDHILFS